MLMQILHAIIQYLQLHIKRIKLTFEKKIKPVNDLLGWVIKRISQDLIRVQAH